MTGFAKLVVLRSQEIADHVIAAVFDRDLTPKTVEREAFRVVAARTDCWGGGAVKAPEWLTVHVDADLYESRRALFEDRSTEESVERKLVGKFCRAYRPKAPPVFRVSFVPDDGLRAGKFTVSVSWVRQMPKPRHANESPADGAMPAPRVVPSSASRASTDRFATRAFQPTERFAADTESSTSDAPKAWLVAKARNLRIPVRETPLLIGTEAPEPGRVVDDTVSRRHLTVWFRDGAVFVTDCGSTNGTRVNGNLASGSTALRDGDLLRLGSMSFEVNAPTTPGSGTVARAVTHVDGSGFC